MSKKMSTAIESPAAVDLEYAIGAQALILGTAKTAEERRAANEELCRLVKLRSPAKVREMEEQKGIAR